MDIGIDLGTTFSVVAVNGRVEFAQGYPQGRYLEECDVTIIPTPEAELTFPSALYADPADPTGYIVGMGAKQAAESGAAPIMWSKRKIGTTEGLRLHERTLTAREVAREILKYLKNCAEQALGQPVDRAVVTHPAYFNRNQVEETRDAARDAGFDMSLPEQMLMEPVAAALAYTRTEQKDPLKIMVYDLGGGTFDVTILERRSGVISCKAYDGDELLGGYNFDRKLVQWLLDRLAAKGRPIPYDENNPDDRARRARLLQWAESTKIRLADMGRRKKVPVDLRPDFLVDGQGRKIQVLERITQEEYVQLIQPELDKTIACTRSCFGKAGMQPADLDYLLLVGGSTYGPWVDELIRRELGIEPRMFPPDLCVGAGAAIHAAFLPPVVKQAELEMVLDVPPRCALLTISIAGHLRGRDESALKNLSLLLKTPRGSTLGPQRVAEDGAFLFPDVALLEDEPTHFNLQVIDGKGLSHLDHTFMVTYDAEGTDIASLSTVLPKPLYIRTAKGMLPLAEEGRSLPSEELQVELRRLFGGSTLDIELFQGDEPAGTITITDIPEVAGEGSKVILRVVVTEKNIVKGKAQVLARSGTVVREWPVRVKFPPLPIPDVSELRAQFRRLEDDRAEKIVLSDDAALRALLAGRGARLAGEIERLFKEQEPDRQELMRAIRELDKLVNPPPDDMDPTRARFDQLLVSCRELLTAKKDDPQMQTYVNMVDRCEREGRDAFTRKDQRRWAAINDSLAALYQRLMPKEPQSGEPELPPTPILKDQALIAVNQGCAALEAVRDSWLARDPAKYEATWKKRCDSVAARLDEMEKAVHRIKDDMKERQALGQVQLALRSLPQINDEIAKIREGIEVTK